MSKDSSVRYDKKTEKAFKKGLLKVQRSFPSRGNKKWEYGREIYKNCPEDKIQWLVSIEKHCKIWINKTDSQIKIIFFG